MKNKLKIFKTIAFMLVMIMTISAVPMTVFAAETSTNIRSLISFIGDFDNTKLSNENYSEKSLPANSHPGYWDEEWVDMTLYRYYELSDEITDISLNGSLRVNYGSTFILFINEMNWDNVYFSGDTISEIPRKLWLFQKNASDYIEKDWTYYNYVSGLIPANYSTLLTPEESSVLLNKWNYASSLGMENATTQEEFNNAVKDFHDYVKLVFGDMYADYTRVDNLYELTKYAPLTDNERSQIDEEYNSYNRNLVVSQQSVVDGYYTDLLMVVLRIYGLYPNYSALCDYSSVIDATKALDNDKDLFSQEEWTTWENVIASVNWKLGQSAQNQQIVDGYANTLFAQSISIKNNFVMKVNSEMRQLLDEFYALDKDLYKEAGYNNAKTFADAQVTNVTFMKIREQIENVKTMKSLIDALEIDNTVEDADYSAVEQNIAIASGIDRSIYTVESLAVLDNTISSVVYGLDETQQSQVDKMASNILAAYNGLVIKNADYTEVNKLVEQFESLRRTDYTNESYEIVLEMVGNIQWNLLITRQSDVDKYASDLKNAIEDLKFKPANYTQLDRVIATIPEEYYKYYDNIEGVQNVIALIHRNATFKEQAMVNKWASDLETAIANLTPKKADYTKLEELLKTIPNDLTVYSKKSVAKLNEVLDGINYELTIFEQDEIDGYVAALKNAIGGLVLKETVYKTVVKELTSLSGKLSELFSNVDELVEYLEGKIKNTHKNAIIETHDVTAMSNTDEDGWKENTDELKESLEIILPYPENTSAEKYDYFVYHMYADGEKAGEIENLEIKTTKDGIIVYSKEFSPYAVVAVEKTEQKPEDDNGDKNEGVVAPGGVEQKPVEKPSGTSIAPQTGDYGYIGYAFATIISMITLFGFVLITFRKKRITQ